MAFGHHNAALGIYAKSFTPHNKAVGRYSMLGRRTRALARHNEAVVLILRSSAGIKTRRGRGDAAFRCHNKVFRRSIEAQGLWTKSHGRPM